VREFHNPPRVSLPPFCHTQEPKRTRFSARVKAYTPLAITYECACTITYPGPRTSNGSSVLTGYPSVGHEGPHQRSPQRDCSRAVSLRKRRGSPTSRPPISCWRLRREPPRVERRFAEGRPRLAYYVDSLVVLMDLGLDPASKEARKMIDRVDKRLLKFRKQAVPSDNGSNARELEANCFLTC